MTDTSTRRWLIAASCVAAVLACLWLLGWIGRETTRAHLLHEAEHRLWVAEYGDPLWSWELRKPRDLVAQKIFGHVQLSTDDEGLLATSTDGSAFEVGLPVRSPMDVAHWPLLQVVLHVSAPTQVRVLWQVDRTAAICTSDQSYDVDADEPMLAIPLDDVTGRQADGSACPRPTVIAWLLRLRMTMPAQASVAFRRAALITRAPPVTPSQPASASGMKPGDMLALPPLARVHLDGRQGANDWLATRDRLLPRAPSAVITVDGDHAQPAPAEGHLEHGAAALCAAYLAVLAWLAWRPRPRWELPAILFGLLWLIAGLQWGTDFARPAALAFLAAVLFAAWRGWRTRPHPWRWLGSSFPAWLSPLALVPVAVLLAWLEGSGWTAPLWRHALTYLGWAALQQWLMLAVVLPRAEAWRTPKPVAWIATALVFALLHTPNGAVMQLCFLAELAWAACFLRWRSILPIAVAHALCALIVEAGLTGGLIRSLEVSARFFL
ncbi:MULTISPECIES: CPBP family intramembrane glutamic endopeptidase [Dyella]|uniref:CPBP family intramembrane metalloprotease n=2 Tax=Dyella TaxID=231454 RepID=A0A4R0YUA1_9GAMM|nr:MULTISPECIES: CPBP family intramembrane glutamic endopeptidase [Dyella]TBR39555.1 CPBP family intramembrane metalloprotease [Dyella terrae]TCI12862.1 CPBP family intramembrane metalloprotease [Dyella soli]